MDKGRFYRRKAITLRQAACLSMALDKQAALSYTRREPDPHTNTLNAHHRYINTVSIIMHEKAKGRGTTK